MVKYALGEGLTPGETNNSLQADLHSLECIVLEALGFQSGAWTFEAGFAVCVIHTSDSGNDLASSVNGIRRKSLPKLSLSIIKSDFWSIFGMIFRFPHVGFVKTDCHSFLASEDLINSMQANSLSLTMVCTSIVPLQSFAPSDV